MPVRSAPHDPHRDIHSDAGAVAGEHPGRSSNPVIKVRGLAWLEFSKPDLVRAEAFARAFGFETVYRTTDHLHLRGAEPGSPCVVIHRGRRTRFLGPAFQAADSADVVKLADRLGTKAAPVGEPLGGVGVDLLDPSGMPLRIVADVDQLPAIGATPEVVFNFGGHARRINTPVRPARTPARVRRLGHVVVMTNRFRESLQWYLDNLGLIVSDFLYYEDQRERGPVMGFIRCDRGSEPADHHTLAMTLGPSNRYVHSAYEVADLDTIAAGGEYLTDLGYRRSWGIGRHIQGSQIFDYWRDPDGFLVEHYADGDLFDSTIEPGWAPMTASGLAQWGPPASADFLGTAMGRESAITARDAITSLHNNDNEFDLRRLRGLLKVPTS
ncbi:MAG: VOC family protein [Gordonia amarae]